MKSLKAQHEKQIDTHNDRIHEKKMPVYIGELKEYRDNPPNEWDLQEFSVDWNNFKRLREYIHFNRKELKIVSMSELHHIWSDGYYDERWFYIKYTSGLVVRVSEE